MAADPHVSDVNKNKNHSKNGKRLRKPNERRWGPKMKGHVTELEKIKGLQNAYNKVRNWFKVGSEFYTQILISPLFLLQIETAKSDYFSNLPLSDKTLKGLKENEYKKPTEIQKASLVYSLKGHDILGAAKTGSGKTLALLIPVICLFYDNALSKQSFHRSWKGSTVKDGLA
jgi:hypothetical protein